MAKRDIVQRESEWVEDQEELVEPLEEEIEYNFPQILEINLPEPTGQPLVLTKNVHLKIKGSVTGNLYVFAGAGSVVIVDEQDVPAMLAKTVGSRSCCGDKPSHYFQIAH